MLFLGSKHFTAGLLLRYNNTFSKQWHAMFMYNLKNNNLNEPMTDMFEISNNEFHNLRSNAVNFHIPKPKTNFLKKSIIYIYSYSGALLWNSLPISEKNRA